MSGEPTTRSETTASDAASRRLRSLLDLDRATLARLAREYQLHGHVLDRIGVPQLGRWGPDEMLRVSIEEWQGASPVYTRRTRRSLGFDGDDVATIFKGLQLDVGAPHQYMDFRFRIDDRDHGEFWLDHCGALMDVEPMGEDMVVMMCHDIEDPTFPATALATNPRAQVLPIHRPPRTPADRHPHCHWRVTIDPDREPVTEIDRTRQVAASALANLELVDPARTGVELEPDGRDDYAGPFDPGFQFEDLSQRALVLACEEFAIQVHLLVRSYLLTITERHGGQAARECARAQLVGTAWIMAERLHRLLHDDTAGGRPAGLDAVLDVLAIHPALQPPEYAPLLLRREAEHRARLALGDGPAWSEGDACSWYALHDDEAPGLRAIAQAVDPRARLHPVTPGAGEVRSWELTVDPATPSAEEPPEVALGRISTSADWEFVEPPTVRSR